MTIASFLEMFQRFGLLFIAAVCFLEHLNLPGFPAGVIMPAIGVLVQQSALPEATSCTSSAFTAA